MENQIDVKLVSLAKVGTNFGSSGGLRLGDKQPLLQDDNDSAGQFANLSRELESLLSQLTSVNDGLENFSQQQPQSAAIQHTLQRHRDILLDYRQEFTKTRANIESLIEREELLSSVHSDIDDYRSSLGEKTSSYTKILLGVRLLCERSPFLAQNFTMTTF